MLNRPFLLLGLSILFASTVGADTAKAIVVAVCWQDGRVAIEQFKTSTDYDSWRNNTLKNVHDKEIELWQSWGQPGPAPLKTVHRRIGTFAAGEIGDPKYEKKVADTLNRMKSDIKKIRANVVERNCAAIGIDARVFADRLDEKKDRAAPDAIRYPEDNLARKVPADRVTLFYHRNTIVTHVGANRIRFRAMAQTRRGEVSDRKLRLVVRFYGTFSVLSEKVTAEYQKRVAATGRANLFLNKAAEKYFLLQYDDPYPVEILADGQWREYVIDLDWQFIRAAEGRLGVDGGKLLFDAADPGCYSIDDVFIEGNPLAMTIDELSQAVKTYMLKRSAPAGDEGETSAPAELPGRIPVGDISNGDMNRPFEDFVANWVRKQSHECVFKNGAIDLWESPGAICVTRHVAERNEDEKPAAKPRAKKSTEPPKEPGFYVTADASGWDPSTAAAQRRKGYQQLIDESKAFGEAEE